jgi:hypothetical protein
VTHEYQGGAEILVALLDILRIVLGRLLLVHSVEVDARIISVDGFEESFESILDATSSQRPMDQRPKQRDVSNLPLGIDLW